MIDVKELRLGNYISVYTDKQIIGAVTHLKPNLIVLDTKRTFRPQFAMPILLTAEILEKCEFGKTVCVENEKLIVYSRDADDYWIGITTVKDMKYLHRLQNLYFSLTGTQLKIKL